MRYDIYIYIYVIRRLNVKLEARIDLRVECKQSFTFLVKHQDHFELGVTLSELFVLEMNHCVFFFKIKISTIIWYESETSRFSWPHCEISQNICPRNKTSHNVLS